MKQLRYVLSFLIAVCGFVSVSAEDIYKLGDQVDALTAGQEFIIAAATPQTIRYYAGTATTTNLIDSATWVAESAGTVGGAEAFYLKNKKSGMYMGYPANLGSLKDVGNDDVPVTNVSDKIDAIKWHIGKPVADETSEFHAVTDEGKQGSGYYANQTDMTVVFVAANAPEYKTSATSKHLWLSCYWESGTAYLSPYPDTNTSNIYKSTNEIDGVVMLQEAMKTFESNDVITLFPVGNSIGQVKTQGLVDAITAAYDNANTLLGSSDPANDALVAAAKALRDAVAAANADRVPVTEGYYRFKVASDQRGADTYMYATPNDGVKVTNNSAQKSLEDPTYIWQVTKRTDEAGGYDIKNLGTSKYIGTTSTNDKAIPMDIAATTAQFIESVGADQFKIYNAGEPRAYHAAGYMSVVIWDIAGINNVSTWQLTPVTAEELATVEAKAKQNALNDTLKAIYTDASKYYAAAFVYKSEATSDNEYATPGLNDDPAMLWSNADYNVLSGGSDGIGLGALVNMQGGEGEIASDYFHSTYRTQDSIKAPHFIGVHLNAPAKTIVVKMSQRNPLPSGNSFPTEMKVYASNDTTGGAWTYVGTLHNLFKGREPKFAISEGLDLGEKYEYLRFDVTKTYSNALTNGVPFFYISEFHVYNAEYDATNSQDKRITNTAELKAAIDAATPMIADGNATQAVIDELKKQYTLFMSQFADFSLVEDAYKAADKIHTNAQEGEGIGYYKSGSKTTFKTAIDAAYSGVNKQSTQAELKAAIAAITTAQATFKAAVNMPQADQWYLLQSSATANLAQTQKYDYATYAVAVANVQPNALNVRWINPVDSATFMENPTKDIDVTTINTNPNALWKFVTVGDSVKIQNFATGLYLDYPSSSSSLSATGKAFDLVVSDSAGVFNIRFGKQNVNAQPGANGTGSVVSWGEASGKDNSAWRIVAAEPDFETGTMNIQYSKPSELRFVTLGFEISGLTEPAKIYTVLGQTADSTQLVLASHTEGLAIPAGTPFVLDLSATTDSLAQYYASNSISAAPLTKDGANGVYAPAKLTKPGYGYFENGELKVSTGDITIPAFTGYLDINVPITAEAGAKKITISGGTLTDISNAVVVDGAAVVNVYTVDGTLVKKNVKVATATAGLPAGLYIVGKTKVLVP